MDRRNETNPTKRRVNLLNGVGSVYGEKESGSKQPATMAEDPMAEELRQMSCESNSRDESFAEPSRRWLPIDRSGVVGVDRPWDNVAYISVKNSTAPERHEQQQPHSRNKKSPSLDVERGSHMEHSVDGRLTSIGKIVRERK